MLVIHNGVAPKALREIHPTGKSPVITDNGLTIAESGAIVEYLIAKYGKGRFVPATNNEQSQLDNTFWMHFAEGSMMPPLVMKLVFKTMQDRSPFFIRPIAGMLTGAVDASYLNPTIKKNMALVTEYLAKDGGRTWLAGGAEPTGADFLMSFPLEAAINGKRLPEEQVTQSMRDYVDRFQSRPAYIRALKKSPDYAYGPKQKL